MPINSFVDESTYDSHTRSSVDSEVSLIENTNEIKYDGINVEVKYPKFGDALYLENTGDANNLTKHFIDGKSLDTSLLPNSWIPVGVVITNECNKVMVAYYKGYNNSATSVKWSNGLFFQIDAITDGTSRSIIFQQCTKTSPYSAVEIGTFTHSCSTQEQFAQELDTWLRANQGGADSGCYTYDWHCDYMENYEGIMKPFVICDAYNSFNQADYDIVKTGATTSQTIASAVPSVTFYKRNNTVNSSNIGINYKRLLEYYDTNTTISNPTSMISVKSGNEIVSRTQFNENQYCADLRTAYGTFEEYIKSVMLNDKTLKQGLGQEQGKSLEWTKALAGKKHKKLDGTEIDTFPAHAWVQSIGFNSDGLRQGDWYLPNVSEMYKIIKDVTYRINGTTLSNCERLNKTLYRMGGTSIRCDGNVSYNLCCKRSMQLNWLCHPYGCIRTNRFLAYNSVISITTLEL